MQKESSTSVRIFYPKFDRAELIQRLQQKLGDLSKELPLLLVILFGSYAQGNYTVASDVDLLIVYEGKGRKDAFAVAKKTLDIPLLEPHVYSEEEYEEHRDVIARMEGGGIVLFSRNE
jgi:predicted nucleotidyltransferase